MLDAALAEQQRATGTAASTDPRPRLVSTGKARNNEASALDRFAAVALREPIITADDNLPEFQRQPTFEAYEAEAADVALEPQRIGVLLVPLAASKIGEVCLDGVVPCRVDMIDAGHQWAGLTEGDTYLTSADEGSAEILWAEGGTGEQWALVRLGSYYAAASIAYATIQEEGSNLTQRATVNFIGAALTAADDAGSTRTNVTLAQSPGTGASVVDTDRAISTSGAALSGGGDLSANRTITLSASPNSSSVVGTGRAVNTSGAALSGGGDLSADRTITLSASPDSSSVVGTGRTISTTTPLAGGGDLSANRTLTVGGLSSIGTATYLVGVNAGGTAWEYKNLTATAPIVVTHGAGSVIVSSTAASASVAGHVTTASQSFAGLKNFVNGWTSPSQMATVQNIEVVWCTDSTYATAAGRFSYSAAASRWEFLNGSSAHNQVAAGSFKAFNDGLGTYIQIGPGIATSVNGDAGQSTTLSPGETGTFQAGILTSKSGTAATPVASVTAGDETVAIGGTATDPTVAVSEESQSLQVAMDVFGP